MRRSVIAGRFFVTVAMAVLVSSCATKPIVETPVSKAELTHFEVSGGLGIWTDTQNISTRMLWQQHADDFSFNLSAPLGMASLRLDQKNSRSTVTRGDSIVATAADPGVALQQALGLQIPVPVSQIAQWLKGEPGDAHTTQLDSAGLLQSLGYTDQSGIRWNAVIRKRRAFQDQQVPALITATGGPFNVRIVLNRWQALEPSPAEVPPEPKTSQRLSIPTQ